MLAYTSQPYAESMAMQPSVSYIPYDTSSKEQTGDIIMFAPFEEDKYYQKLVMIHKAVKNMMTIQLLKN